MNMTGRVLALSFAFLSMNNAAFTEGFQLKGRSALEFNLGMWAGSNSSTSVEVSGIHSEARTNGFTGSLLFTHWMQENVSVTLSAGFLAGEATYTAGIFGVSEQASAVIPLLLGVRYYLPEPGTDDAVRPYLAAAMGTYVGMEAKNTQFVQQARSEAVMGGSVGGGVDFLLSDHFKAGANIRYNLTTDFGTPIGMRRNGNGADFSIGIGYIF